MGQMCIRDRYYPLLRRQRADTYGLRVGSLGQPGFDGKGSRWFFGSAFAGRIGRRYRPAGTEYWKAFVGHAALDVYKRQVHTQ